MTSPGPARPGKIVIGTLGLDQHEVGAMAISAILVRHGYEVIGEEPVLGVRCWYMRRPA